MAAIALFGVVAYRALPVSDLPQVDYPTLNVSASLPGGDPGTMASSVASPLERQFTTIAGLDSMTSRSGSGSTNITLQFDLDRDIDSATVDVQTAIAAVMPLLPAGMPSAPSFRKNNPNDQPIITINLTSNTLPLPVLDDYAETMIAPRLSMVSGVSQVQVMGAAKYAVRVQLDPEKLHAERIGINEVDQAITNSIAVADAVRTLLPTFEKQLPPSAHLTPRQDRSRTIRKAFTDIQVTMLVTLLLVVGVIFLFLHNGSATLIPALALPFSILGTFAVMQVLNFSLNNLSMMALILSIGFVVDDAIVMLENIVRHMEQGEGPFEAALEGSKEIGFTILTMTTSLAAVFIPILFMSGILGRLFREFAVTITTAILISGLVSVTLTPMLCSRFLRVVHSKKGFAGLMDRAFDALLAGYDWSLRLVLRHRLVMLVVFFVVAAATVHMFNIVPTGFIPDQDNDSMFVNLQAAQGTSFYDMSKWTQQVADIVIKNPYVDSFMASVGGGPGGPGGGGGGANNGRLMVQLVPRATRPVTAQQIAQQMRPLLLRFPGFRGFVGLPPSLQIGGRMGNQNYSLMMQAMNTDDLYGWAPH